ncbi:MAG: hypothetical protein U0103_16205 [Candidatus Obscuribacterales bacterium]|nr:hypothetical protein [Cyanobacteria bacterium SZAS LIN-5]
MSDRLQMSDARQASPQGQGIAYSDVMSGPRTSNPTEPHGPITPPVEPPGKPPVPGSSASSDASASAVSSGSITNRQVFLNSNAYAPGLAGGGECTKSKSSGVNILGLIGVSGGESGPDPDCMAKRQEVIKQQTVCTSAVNDAMVASNMMDKVLQAGREYNTNPAARPVSELAGAVATQFAGSSLKQAGACDSIAQVYTGKETTLQLPSLQIDQSDVERTRPKPVEAPKPVPAPAPVVEQQRTIVHHKVTHPVAKKHDVDCEVKKK